MSSKPHKGSQVEWLAGFALFERRWINATLETYKYQMSAVQANIARSPHLKGLSFSVALYTAVSASRAGDIRYLICVERTA